MPRCERCPRRRSLNGRSRVGNVQLGQARDRKQHREGESAPNPSPARPRGVEGFHPAIDWYTS